MERERKAGTERAETVGQAPRRILLFPRQAVPPNQNEQSASALFAQARTASGAPLLPSWRLSARQLTNSTAERLGSAGGATRGLCCGHLGRSSGASQRLGRASFTHAATTEMSGHSVEPGCKLHVKGRLWPQQVH